ncbi:aldolase catalytic domain-containing protein [Aminipila luticellarii]|uniref:4-hydroxy-2-ketovalerate aldolase n=1 Tax=Aminipila luticellarii TaxID=2507160 RepID=A0A410PSI0_9FIRM|nr:aldolase catalytic domain-containing protein [Aminipila luticellarii]QAT41922.1 4-hydroxy-2-ketovalerate aldolase [Aminipila luticellarii]
MNKIRILDCTLRDGGYINHWNFGRDTIQEIISNLTVSGIEIIECGFLRDVPYQEDVAVFSCVSQITPFIASKKEKALYVAMIALGDINPEKILPYDGTSIGGIRLTFHKHEWAEAKSTAAILKEKGYQVFVQPVGTTSYSDEELLGLIKEVNGLQPYAFYLVDTLGILYRHDLLRLFYLIDHNLDPQIKIGFHSHNNLQLSFANAQELLRLHSKRELILDASVYGMGRGVGNLATELLAEYINVNIEPRYHITPLLTIADQYLSSIFSEQRWGYALPYFLSAVEQCHPNYAAHLLKKETLTIESIFKILSLLPADKKDIYHPEMVDKLYLDLQNCEIDDETSIEYLKKSISGKTVLLLAPGITLDTHKGEIQTFVEREDPLIISTNFISREFESDILFVSNRKRLNAMQKEIALQPYIMATSNLLEELPSSVKFMNYSSYLGEGQAADNAGAMLIRILNKAGVVKIALAGFDGFDVDSTNNYYINSFKSVIERKTAEQKNEDITRQLRLALNGIPYQLVTPTRYGLQ